MEIVFDSPINQGTAGETHSLVLSADNYKMIFDNSAVAITVTDANENIVQWNKFAETLLGMDYEDLYLKPVKDLYPEEEWFRIRSEHIRQKGPHHHMETRIITRNHELIDVALSISVLNNSAGEVVGSIGIIRDITANKKTERVLKESMELSRGMIETAASAIFLISNEKFSFANRILEEISGYSTEELLGMDRLDLIYPEYREQARSNLTKTSQEGATTRTEFRIIRKDLETTWVSERLTTISYQGQSQILGDWMDITEWKIAEEVSKNHSRQTELLLKIGSLAGQTLNVKNIIDNFLLNLTDMLPDRSAAFFLRDEDSELLSLVSQQGFSDDFVKRMSTVKLGKGFIGRVAFTGLSLVLSPTYHDPRFDPAILERENFWSLCSVPIFARERIRGVICVGSHDKRHSLEDDTQLFELIARQIGMAIDNAIIYEKTAEMAFTDGLTGLYNRRYLFEELSRELSRAERNQTNLSVISMDVDNLKEINDRFGHNYGDIFLKEFSGIISSASRKMDIAARIGGDEFILLTPECDPYQAEKIAQRIQVGANTKRLLMKGEDIFIKVSIGISSYPINGNSIDDILNKADKAMYEVKKAGKNHIKLALPD